MIYTVGLFGSSEFTFLLKILFEKAFDKVKVKIYSRKNTIDEKIFFSFDEVINSNLVVPSVPISKFEETINLINSRLNTKNIIMDVCSIKEYPTNVMTRILNDKCRIISTHPHFGPGSYKNNKSSFKNLGITMFNVSATNKEFSFISNSFAKLGIKILDYSPKEHDELISQTHYTSLFIGNLISRLGLEENENLAYSSLKMFELGNIVKNDWGILQDMFNYIKNSKDLSLKIKYTFEKMIESLEKNEKNI